MSAGRVAYAWPTGTSASHAAATMCPARPWPRPTGGSASRAVTSPAGSSTTSVSSTSRRKGSRPRSASWGSTPFGSIRRGSAAAGPAADPSRALFGGRPRSTTPTPEAIRTSSGKSSGPSRFCAAIVLRMHDRSVCSVSRYRRTSVGSGGRHPESLTRMPGLGGEPISEMLQGYMPEVTSPVEGTDGRGWTDSDCRRGNRRPRPSDSVAPSRLRS